MTGTQATTAAAAIAEALIDAAEHSTGHRRLFLRGRLSIPPASVFAALEPRLTHEVTVGADGPRQMAAAPAGHALLIPYLVDQDQPGPNRGLRGYAGTLRTDFAAHSEAGRPHVLLVLDPHPFETVLTAAEDASQLPQLHWSRLVEAIARPASGPAAQVVAAVAADLAGIAEELRGGGLLDAFAAFASASWPGTAEAGLALADLPLYLADPQPTAPRLRQSREWRHWLEIRSRPDRDLAAELVRYAGQATPGIKKVLDAHKVSGLDWHAVTLDDLPARPDRSRAALVFPAQLHGVRSFLPTSNAVAAWMGPEDESLAVSFTGNPQGLDQSASVRWAGRDPEKPTIDEAALLVHIRVPGAGSAGWQFGRLELRRGQHLDLAVFRGTGTWFPVERGLDLDQLAEAFISSDPPSIAAVGPDGVVLGSAQLVDSPDDSDSGERAVAPVEYGGQQQHIPLLADTSPEVAPDPGEADGSANGDGPQEEDTAPGGGTDTGPEDEGDDEEPGQGTAPSGPVATGAHALLEFAAARARSNISASDTHVKFSNGGAPEFSGGGINRPLEDQALGAGLDGLALEAAILKLPAALAYSVTREGSSPRLTADRAMEALSLEGLSAPHVEAFFTAREAFFSRLSSSGSVHAVLCGVGLEEARAYVDAYQALLLSLPVPGRYKPEYDRLLLCDLVADPQKGLRWLAPTNPVTVAWALKLAADTAAWAQQGAQLPQRDLQALTPAFLLPLVHLDETWWEADPRSPRLWRRYQPLGASLAVGAGDPRTITRRLEKFLAIFETYRDPRQRLAVAVHQPGDGDSVAQALRIFYRPESRPGANQFKPALDVTVHTTGGHVPGRLAELVAPDNDNDLDKFIRSRISLTCLPLDEQPGFAHLSFVFRSPAQREPRVAQLDERAPTAWADGLATAPGRHARVGTNEMEFASGLFIDPSRGPLGPLLGRTLELVGGQPRGQITANTTQATTTVIGRSAMHGLYRTSVWTTHADRLLGPEAFASAPGQAPSIVDFDDRSEYGQAGSDSVTVTARMEPYRVALTRAFAPGATLEPDALAGLIDLGNAVSGRWNMDLLSLDDNRVRERVGVLAAIAALRDLDGAFAPADGTDDASSVLLSLHELLQLLKASGIQRPTTRLCDDLLYLRIKTGADGHVRLYGRLIEVKYATSGRPDLAVARSEIEATRQWLDHVYNTPGPTRPFRARDLAEFIRAGAARNASFGLSPQCSAIEDVATAIAEGRFDLSLEFTAADEQYGGDVISLELDSPLMAHRQRLPGEGPAPLGYIRLGTPALQHLAKGEPLPPSQGWPQVTFPGGPGTPPAPGATATGPAGTGPAAPGAGSPAADPSADAAEDGAEGPMELPANDSAAVTREVAAKAAELDEAAAKYDLNLAPFDTAAAQVGPSVIRYRTRLLGKQTIAGVRSKALDLGREIGVAEGVLVDQEPYYMTVDVPRQERVVVPLSGSLHRLQAADAPGALPFLLGVAPSGEVRVEDLARLPHLLVAGATGSGKSVLLRGLLCCLARVRSPQQLQIMIIDPKQVDFMPFEDLPHLADGRIITDPAEAISVLTQTLEHEVTERRAKLKAVGATSVLEYYEMGHSLEELPQMVILVDEFADLAGSLKRKDRQSFMELIQRFGQLTRAFGIYLVLATQRPSVQVITGDIKANLTARVALKVQSAVDSTTILGRGGAETLRDRGDLLFDHSGSTQRLQAFFTTLDDVRAVTALWR
ncbi:FtsK/SpoIIIE domain-containing protein [Streptomyces sp. NPDC049097]|uniref:FtsK/SpoIIIE domain-containing protein n=1 Tax=Streptomyces sp. NPDC049097 TaxID=3155497 RepID=UPI0034208245